MGLLGCGRLDICTEMGMGMGYVIYVFLLGWAGLGVSVYYGVDAVLGAGTGRFHLRIGLN